MLAMPDGEPLLNGAGKRLLTTTESGGHPSWPIKKLHYSHVIGCQRLTRGCALPVQSIAH